MGEKSDNSLSLALEIPQEELMKSQGLMTGFDSEEDVWELIVRYTGNLDKVREINGVDVRELSNGYAVLNVKKELIDEVANVEEIIYIEKPTALIFSLLRGKQASCINEVQQTFANNENNGLFGEGVIVGIADSGIDFTHEAFRNQDGTTRILNLWDQTNDRVYNAEEINEALKSENPYESVNSVDYSGHGTHVAGIAAGNFAENKNDNLGIATKSSLVIVKMALAGERSFPRTTQLMEAVDYMIKVAESYKMPLAMNLSFGNSYGSHDGTSLLSTYLDSMADGRRVSICVGAGNEGDSAGHAGGYVFEPTDVEVQVSRFQKAFSIQLWKNFSDEFRVQIIAPSGFIIDVTEIYNRAHKYEIDETNVYVFYGTPKPYTQYQEIYFELIPVSNYVKSGIWTIRLTPENIVTGRYDMWLPEGGIINENTSFLRPDPDITLTVPSTSSKVISVGAYNSSNDVMASFSGRGFTRETNQVKPDIVAPGVNISSASNTGGVSVRTGTSMATPFVCGSAALMMEWGIVRGNDPFLYGQKLKSYLIKGSRKLPGFTRWPNEQAGWGALCVSESIPK
ncbi:peptidase S8 [Eubacterium sp. AF15-50]|uniref:S8 family peptidase n=1 Tax=unclassified Eubacterium (in: firmicutes) TaxID=2624479 RepID=UPI000E4BD1EF|nr:MULTISPECIES: S8 family peptidase [unclassified Eubacterium (in: firmicutes)]RHR74499.1 peptidase S8 [Eubacterium sp. AF16-48]RHR82034.1 peptidase S8 [Eubacterium sp. AF15-50]